MGKTLLKLFSDRLFAVARASSSRSLCSSSSSLPAISSFSCQRSALLPWRCRFSSSNTVSQDLSITEGCAKRIQEIVKEEGSSSDKKMLRLSVEGGGCSGFQYVFALDDKLSSSDRVFKKDGVMVVVDEISMDFVKGATIDYVEELIRSSFMVTQNPNASGGCGCGSSFNVK